MLTHLALSHLCYLPVKNKIQKLSPNSNCTPPLLVRRKIPTGYLWIFLSFFHFWIQGFVQHCKLLSLPLLLFIYFLSITNNLHWDEKWWTNKQALKYSNNCKSILHTTLAGEIFNSDRLTIPERQHSFIFILYPFKPKKIPCLSLKIFQSTRMHNG